MPIEGYTTGIGTSLTVQQAIPKSQQIILQDPAFHAVLDPLSMLVKNVQQFLQSCLGIIPEELDLAGIMWG